MNKISHANKEKIKGGEINLKKSTHHSQIKRIYKHTTPWSDAEIGRAGLGVSSRAYYRSTGSRTLACFCPPDIHVVFHNELISKYGHRLTLLKTPNQIDAHALFTLYPVGSKAKTKSNQRAFCTDFHADFCSSFNIVIQSI